MELTAALFIFLCLVLAVFLIYASIPLINEILVLQRVKSLPIPGFYGSFLFNNTFQVIKAFGKVPGLSVSVYMFSAVSGICAVFRQHHSMVRFILGTRAAVVLFKADAVEAILSDNKEVNKSQEYRFIEPWLGTGLLTSSYHKWKKHRKLLTPSFHFRILDQFQPVMSEKSDILVEKLKSLTDKDFVFIEDLIANCAMDIIAETSLGTSLNTQRKEHPYVKASQRATEMMFKRFLYPWLWPDIFFRISPTGRAFYKCLDVMSAFVRKVIQEKRSELSQDLSRSAESTSKEKGEFESKKRRAFLEMLLQHNLENPDAQLCDRDIEDEVQTFAFAGHDTTMTTVCWTMYYLGLYPEVQAKVREEMDSVFSGDLKRTITMDDLRSMVYLERVIKETMRLTPPVTFIGRLLQDDLTIGGVKIPKGVTAIVNVPVLHRDPEYFPNPEVFDPDRFLETQRHPYAYVPFSAGPRNCIGQRFAMLESKTILSNVIRSLRWTSLDPRDRVLTSPEIVSRPSKPIKLKFSCV